MSMFVFENEDKDDWMRTENWRTKYNPNDPSSILNIPISRMLILGLSGSGKTNLIKNIIAHQEPEYQKIIVVHHDPDTKEYRDLEGGDDFFLTTEIPGLEMFKKDEDEENEDENIKYLVIFDDVYTKGLKKEDEKKFNKLITYVSTHKQAQVIISTQDYTTISPAIRRNINIFCLYKIHDRISQKLLTKKLGLSTTGLYKIFSGRDPIIKKKHDFLMYDTLPDAPLSKFRINGITPINMDLDLDDDIEEKLEKERIHSQKY